MFQSNHQPPCLVLLDLQPHRRDFAASLSAAGFQTRCVTSGLPDTPPEVIVADREDTVGWRARFAEWLSSGQLGLIGIGVPQPAEVCLPDDVSPRELALAVHLVARIIGLRRQQQQARTEQHTWRELALRDALTGLPNRHAWQKELSLRLAAGAVTCVALLDVDFFKQVNDQQGHHVGDQVLCEIATALQAHLRAEDFVARLGGDEYGLLLTGVGETHAVEIIERARTSVSRELAAKGLPAPTLSAGFVCYPIHSPGDSRVPFAAAAASLRQAKRRQRNCTVAYSPDVERREAESAS